MLSGTAQNVLARGRWDGPVYFLPEQLERETYKECNDVLTAVGGKWSRKAGGHVFEESAESALTAVVASGEMPDKNPLDYYPTPDAVADTLVELCPPKPGDKILEPSAGTGNIVRAVIHNLALQYAASDDHTPASITMVEADWTRFQKLVAEFGTTTYHGDFLTMPLTLSSAPIRFDRIYMNPPFTVKGNGKVWIDHVAMAFTYLRQNGGRLAAIVPASIEFAQDKKTSALRAMITGPIHKLPEGAFNTSGTMVNCRMITISK